MEELAGGFTILESPVEDDNYHIVVDSSEEIINQIKADTENFTLV